MQLDPDVTTKKPKSIQRATIRSWKGSDVFRGEHPVPPPLQLVRLHRGPNTDYLCRTASEPVHDCVVVQHSTQSGSFWKTFPLWDQLKTRNQSTRHDTTNGLRSCACGFEDSTCVCLQNFLKWRPSPGVQKSWTVLGADLRQNSQSQI